MGVFTSFNLRTRVTRNWIGGLIVFLFVASATILAQLPTATVLGVVKDSSGAVVAGVKLTVRNVDTSQSRVATTDEGGSYRFPALPVGNYEVRAEKDGFRSEVQEGLTLTVSQEAVLNFTLGVSSLGQTVSVTAEAPLVNTTTSSLGSLVSEQKVADLPLNGRNYITLTLLQPGVNPQLTGGSNGSGGFVGTYFSSNGAPVRSNNYLLDGAIMTNVMGATSASASNATLGVDGILEFRIITNSFSAEYGMTMGSQMIIVSKGGTNVFHGDAFEYMRNSVLDAANYFDRPVAANNFRRLPELQRNNFGGSIGGPIKKDKTFFFGVFEKVKEEKGITTIDTVPPAACHTTTNIVSNQACLGATTPGTTTVRPVIQPLLALFPLPNLPNNQYTYPYTQPTNDYYGQMRVDHSFSANDSIFARYTVDNTTQAVTQSYSGEGTNNQSRLQLLTASENHIFSPSLLNTFRASFSRSVLNFEDFPTCPIGPGYSITPGWDLAGVSVGGVTGNGCSSFYPVYRKQNIFTYSDDMFYTLGRHSLKFGALFNHYQLYDEGNVPKGSVSFSNLTNFLLAQATKVSSVAGNALLTRTFHYTTLGFYAQDDFRVRSNLTLNLGLRYEFLTVPQEQHGQWGVLQNIFTGSQFVLGSSLWGQNPSLHNFGPRVGFAWDVMGDGKTAVRGGFGLLYDVGNIGALVFQSLSGNPPLTVQYSVANPAVLTIPYVFPTTAAAAFPRPTDYYMKQPHLMSYNLTLERQLPFNVAFSLAYAGSHGINLDSEKEGNPAIPNGVPGVVGGLEACVAPAAGQAVPNISEVDGVAKGCFLGTPPRRNPNFGSFDLFTTGVNSWYNALQFSLIKRISKGLQFQSSYTWSKSIDQDPGYSDGEQTQAQSSHAVDPFHLNVDKGPSILDITNVWKFNAIYNLPRLGSLNGFRDKLVNGWWMSGIVSLQDGLPFTPDLNSNRSLNGVQGGGGGNDRPDRNPNRSISSIVSGTTAGCGSGSTAILPGALGTATRYFDPCAFSLQPIGFLGNSGRNDLRGPGFDDVDFSLVKDTAVSHLGEAGKVEFRAEVFNLLNHPNLGLPNRVVFAGTSVPPATEAPLSTAGQITSTGLLTSRQIQFALKILF